MIPYRKFLSVTLLCIALQTSAEEMKYRPINPSFGGNPLNGPNLMNSASVQRQFSAPRKRRSSAEQFSELVQDSLMSRIAREIANQIMGPDSKESGQFSLGSSFISFHREGGQVVVDIRDDLSGGNTTIQLPVPSAN